jgi:hypothetical protein
MEILDRLENIRKKCENDKNWEFIEVIEEAMNVIVSQNAMIENLQGNPSKKSKKQKGAMGGGSILGW